MKRVAKTPKIALPETILATAALLLVGFVGWYALHAKQASSQLLDDAQASIDQMTVTRPSTNISVDASRLPANWRVDSKQPESVLIRNDSTLCWAQVVYKTAQNMPTDDTLRQRQTLISMQQKGFNATVVGDTIQNLQTSNGTVQINAKTYRVRSDALTVYQTYGFVGDSQKQVSTQLSCPRQTDLSVTATTLQAVTVNIPIAN